jgi:single-strand DNA-binding protein
VDVTLWGRTAEVANQYLSKGSPMFVEGRLKLDSWEKDGQKHYKLRVVGERLQLLPRGGGGGGNRGSGSPQPDVSEYSRPAEEFEPPQMAAASTSGTQPQQSEDIPF